MFIRAVYSFMSPFSFHPVLSFIYFSVTLYMYVILLTYVFNAFITTSADAYSICGQIMCYSHKPTGSPCKFRSKF